MYKANFEYFHNCLEGYLKSEIDNVVSQNDEMYNCVLPFLFPNEEERRTEEAIRQAATIYYGAGQDAAYEVFTACMGSYLDSVNSVLDLACGHGRVTRHLVKLFPDARFFAADINRDGVDFCADQFGAKKIHLPDDLGEHDFGHSFDVIWSGSLFTHYPRETVKRWITHICNNHLSSRGIFVFTIHGRRMIREREIREDYELISEYYRTGYGFRNEGNFMIDSIEDGLSVTAPSAFVQDIHDIRSVKLLSYREATWHERHDVVAVGKPAFIPHQVYELRPRPFVFR